MDLSILVEWLRLEFEKVRLGQFVFISGLNRLKVLEPNPFIRIYTTMSHNFDLQVSTFSTSVHELIFLLANFTPHNARVTK